MCEPPGVATVARNLGLTRGAFYHAENADAFDCAMYCAVKDGQTPLDCFRESQRRGHPLDAEWWGDLWFESPWLSDGWRWMHEEDKGLGFLPWLATVAARKIMHLAHRRGVVHAAREAIRDALGGSMSPDEMDDFLEGRLT